MLVFEQQLLARKAEVNDRIDSLTRAAAAHGTGGAAAAFADPGMWERLTDLEKQTYAELRAVDNALERLKRGTFGLCLECGEPMSFLRLEGAPWAEFCEDCEQ